MDKEAKTKKPQLRLNFFVAFLLISLFSLLVVYVLYAIGNKNELLVFFKISIYANFDAKVIRNRLPLLYF
jgi:hypothetical protein